jgi:hypothetical protein
MPALEELRVEMHTSYSLGAFEDLTADEFYETWLGPLDALTQPLLRVFEVVFEKAYFLRFGVRRQGKRYRLVNAPEIDRSRPEHLSGWYVLPHFKLVWDVGSISLADFHNIAI